MVRVAVMGQRALRSWLGEALSPSHDCANFPKTRNTRQGAKTMATYTEHLERLYDRQTCAERKRAAHHRAARRAYRKAN